MVLRSVNKVHLLTNILDELNFATSRLCCLRLDRQANSLPQIFDSEHWPSETVGDRARYMLVYAEVLRTCSYTSLSSRSEGSSFGSRSESFQE